MRAAKDAGWRRSAGVYVTVTGNVHSRVSAFGETCYKSPVPEYDRLQTSVLDLQRLFGPHLSKSLVFVNRMHKTYSTERDPKYQLKGVCDC